MRADAVAAPPDSRGTARRAVRVRRAGVLPRVAAYVVDWLVMVIVGSLLVAIGGMQLYWVTDRGRNDPPDAALYAFLVICGLTAPVWAVMTLVGWSWSGRSVGKLAMGLRILTRGGGRPGLLRGCARLVVFTLENLLLFTLPVATALRLAASDAVPLWALGAAAALSLAALAALAPALLWSSGRPLHDLAAGTIVVEE